ncbi:hypothetical protein [Stenotrophomonas maltophilia]|uniref:hypothetical protein n=1 Tax=Stenotrophomonas maltophilia TaxID=40324 RepID=UPI000F4D2F0C|nr:hypothetical protein [Stenotrophomonas maltophilia]AYZ71298.1 hypothetical protein EGY09_15295 [Stenotrophomonas maltophilia]
MNAIEKRARDLLAAEYERIGNHNAAGDARRGLYQPEIAAVVAALTPPEGYVLVPVEPTDDMLLAAYRADTTKGPVTRRWFAMLAARPEVP